MIESMELSSTKDISIPGYELLEEIGVGANARVFRARHLKLDRIDAVKVLHRQFNEDKLFVKKLQAEAKAVAMLNHPHIVTVYDVGTTGRYHYMAMQYVPGRSAGEWLKRQNRVEEKCAIGWVLQVAEALKHAHSLGVVHCDIKPSNILITPQDQALLADFGLARSIYSCFVRRHGPAGTPLYNSPEQIRGDENLDPRADMYSLGATFYHLVTGRPPFQGKTADEVIRQHLVDPIVPPDHVVKTLSSGVGQVIEVMMAKDMDDRYESAEQLIVDLRMLVDGQSPSYAVDNFLIEKMVEIEHTTPSEMVRVKSSFFDHEMLLVLLGLSLLLNVFLFIMLWMAG